MEQKQQSEIGPDPVAGVDTTESREEESFEEATDLLLSRQSSPVLSKRQLMYQGVYQRDGRTDGRTGLAEDGQASDPVSVQKPFRGNPFGNMSEAFALPTGQGNPGFSTFPNMMKVDKVTRENFLTWKVKMELASINSKCYIAFAKPLPMHYENTAAMMLLLNSVPEIWHATLIKEGSAHDAMHWVLEQFDGGMNEYHVDELEDSFQSLRMGPKETHDAFVMRAVNISMNLASNARAVTHSHLVDKIVNGLPDTFNSSKSTLRLLGRGMTTMKLADTIKKEARHLGISKQRGTDDRALSANVHPGNNGYKGKNKANGNSFNKKLSGVCYNCGKTGHNARDCTCDWTNYSFKPKRTNGNGGQNEESRALITNAKGNRATQGQYLVDGQEWVVDSGASHHITGDPYILHEYVGYNVPKPLGTAVKSGVAQIMGQGTVCLEGIDGATFWLKEVRYVPGLTQNLYSMIAGNAQGLVLTMTTQGEFVSVKLPHGKTLCLVKKANKQYLLDARALNGSDKKTYHSMLAREGRVLDVSAMLTSLEETDLCELWHRRMGHPSRKALSRLVKEQMATGVKIPIAQLNHALQCRCETCILGKMTHLSFPLSTSKTNRPLELIHVDLCGPLVETNRGEKYFMAIMDDFSKYAMVYVMSEKSEAKGILTDTLKEWSTQCEVSVKVLRSDGGKEFVSNLVTEYCKSLGIQQQVTPRYTPESNGKIERLNRTIKEKVRCMLLDSHLPVEWWGLCIEYAVLLRNCLPVSGKTATPFELFSGNVPDLTHMKVFGCKAYVRLEKADHAYSKLGPQSESGIFMGIEPNTKAYRVLIGTEIRVSRHVRFSEEKFMSTGTVNGLMPLEHEEYDGEPDICEEDYDVIMGQRRVLMPVDPFPEPHPRLVENVIVEQVAGPVEESPEENAGRDELTFPPDWKYDDQQLFDFPEETNNESDDEHVTDKDVGNDADPTKSPLKEAMGSEDEGASMPGYSEDGSSVNNDTSEANPCAPEVGCNRYSLRSKGPVDPDDIDALCVQACKAIAEMTSVPLPKSYKEAVHSEYAEKWKGAMLDEMNSIESKHTFVLVPRPKGGRIIPSRWVYALKQDSMGNIVRFKARVVAKGYKQIEGVDFNETYAPVCNQDTRRVLFALAAQYNLHMHQVDVKTAFLNGKLTDLTYCEPPPGFADDKNVVWELRKALYGLKQAPRAWHECLVKALVDGGFIVSEHDAGLFLKRTKTCTIYLITYVDDMIIACAELPEILTVKEYLAKVFEITDLGEVSHFLGNVVVRDANTVRVSNPVKVKELLADYGIENPKKVLTPMDPGFVITDKPTVDGTAGGSGKALGEGNRYNELIGSLLYLANTTRPDISLAVGILSRFRMEPTTSHWNAGMRVLYYLNQTQDKGLEYSGNHDVVGYVDSAYADDKDTFHSTMGYTFILNGAAVSWASKKQRTVATSTVEAEYIAFQLAAQQSIWLQKLLHEMVGRVGPITIKCDSTGCIANLKNTITSAYTKHIATRYHVSREWVANMHIVPEYIPTDENVADVFTKPLVHVKFSKFRDGLGMT